MPNESDKIELSILIPVYNGRENLGPLSLSLCEVLDRNRLKGEIVFVDDGSSDGSFKRIEALNRGEPRIRGGRLVQNRGQQNALYAGLSLCRGEYIITMDDDGQHPPSEIVRLINKAKESFDVVYMVRRSDSRSLIYRAGTRGVDLFFTLFCNKPAELKIGSYRLLTKKVSHKILSTPKDFIYLSALIFQHISSERIASLTYEEHSSPVKGRINLTQRLGLFLKLFRYYGPFSSRPQNLSGFSSEWERIL
ncbi:MAG: glycosyltransferase family 2 protein [Spirochaetales bacterium]|nr:glycosyltransferase family 2 protein [Spirochaetales bacterium]